LLVPQFHMMEPSAPNELGVITKLLLLTVASMFVTTAVITPFTTPREPILVRAAVETPKLL